MRHRLCIECFRELEEHETSVCEFCDTDELEVDPWRDWDAFLPLDEIDEEE